MKLSDQALGAIMMALQKSLLEQSDIVPVLKGLNFQLNEVEELTVLDPPSFTVSQRSQDSAESEDFFEENTVTTGSD